MEEWRFGEFGWPRRFGRLEPTLEPIVEHELDSGVDVRKIVVGGSFVHRLQTIFEEFSKDYVNYDELGKRVEDKDGF